MTLRWNDYYKLGRLYLQNYEWYKLQIKRLNRETKQLRAEANAINVPNTGGYVSAVTQEHFPQNTAVERGVFRRIRLLDGADRLEENRILLENRIAAIDRALETLTEEQQTFLRLFYIEDRRYAYIACKVHMCESWCKLKTGKATVAFCTALFGDIARESVCFAPTAAGHDAQSEAIYRVRALRRRNRSPNPEQVSLLPPS